MCVATSRKRLALHQLLWDGVPPYQLPSNETARSRTHPQWRSSYPTHWGEVVITQFEARTPKEPWVRSQDETLCRLARLSLSPFYPKQPALLTSISPFGEMGFNETGWVVNPRATLATLGPNVSCPVGRVAANSDANSRHCAVSLCDSALPGWVRRRRDTGSGAGCGLVWAGVSNISALRGAIWRHATLLFRRSQTPPPPPPPHR